VVVVVSNVSDDDMDDDVVIGSSQNIAGRSHLADSHSGKI